MLELARRESLSGVNRIFYQDSEGQLVEKILHNHDAWQPTFKDNAERAAEYRPFSKNHMQKVASIPADAYLKIMIENGFADDPFSDEATEFFMKKIANNHEYAAFRCVPQSYTI